MTDTSNDDGSRGGLGAVLRLQIELWLVVLFMALAFGAGILITALYEEPAATPVVGVQDPAGAVVAPPLTDDQIQGGLPSGHPDLGGASGATGATGETRTKDGSNGESAEGGGK
jgi:hypothetical protein